MNALISNLFNEKIIFVFSLFLFISKITFAEKTNTILFFDEADSMFGVRSEVHDSKDRYANTEISYLLQRIEAYDGIVIMATNIKGNIDPAFIRRIRYVVNFENPDEELRREILL